MSGMRHVSSRDNPQFKALRALAADPRGHGRAIADGIHLVATCFARGVAVRQLLVSESGQHHAEVATLLHGAAGLDCVCMRDSLFRELSGVATPTGIAAVIDIPPAQAELPAGEYRVHVRHPRMRRLEDELGGTVQVDPRQPTQLALRLASPLRPAPLKGPAKRWDY